MNFERVFVRSAEVGLATQNPNFGRQSKEMILDSIASELNESVDNILSFLYADHKDMHRLTNFHKLKQQWTYCIDTTWFYASLFYCMRKQLELFYCTNPVVNGQMLFRRIKFYRLFFRVWKYEDRVELLIDGPQSLLSQSNRYGLQFAMFLPLLPLFQRSLATGCYTLVG